MPVLSRKARREVKTVLFLTAGPYFWPHQDMIRMRFELLSRDFDGFILSYVSQDKWRRMDIGRFELNGYRISGLAYKFFVTRHLIRTCFVLVRSLSLHFRRRRIDAIVAYDPFGTGVLGYIVSRLIGARLVVEVNNDFRNMANWNVSSWSPRTFFKSTWVRLVGPFIMNRSDAVRAIYPGQLDGFERLNRSTRVEYFHPCVATSLFRKEPTPNPPRRILFVGHPFYLKGVDLLLRAFNDITDEFPEFTLRLVGHLPEKDQYRELFEKNPRVEFFGSVMPDQVRELSADCYVLVLPSRSEGMPRVLMEALASGRPVIASSVGGIPHYLRHGETGVLFEREDVEGLKKALRDVLGNDDYARRVGENGRRYLLETLSDARHVEAMTRMLRSL
jgi:glycosyltransferase involved in cell wall biosynthesis